MDNSTLNRFKELLSVPSKTYQEDKMVEYLSWVLDSMDGVEYYTDEMNNIYATKRQDGFNGYFPMFVAHTDTVHAMVPEIVVKEQTLPKPPTFGRTFDDTQYDVLKAYTPDGNPTGIGGDDKCGIFICLELLRVLSNVKVGFFVSEETGCIGSSKCDVKFLNNVGYVVQYDAPGNHLITEVCSGVRLFEENGEFINRALPVIQKTMETDMEQQSHPYTDVSQIKKKSDVSCINLSCGYYQMHTPNEFVVLDDVDKAIRTGINLVNEFGYEKQEYAYEPPVYSYGGLFNLDDTEDDSGDWDNTLFDGLDEETYELNDHKVVVEWGGVTIESNHTGDVLYLDEDDAVELYKILRENFLLKGVE